MFACEPSQGGVMESKDLGWELKKTTDVLKLYVNRFVKSCFEKNDVCVSWTEGAILTYAATHKDKIISAKLLMKELRLSKATMSQTLSSLVCKGLIEYDEWEEDGRVKRILLTKKANDLWEDVAVVMKNANEFFVMAFSEDELNQFIELLHKLRNHISAQEKALQSKNKKQGKE